MPRFTTFDGIALAYDVTGEGPPVVLLHGFAADSAGNWGQPGVVAALAAAGRQVITLDARGHGLSDKPHDPAAYEGDAMVRDVQALFDHLDLDLDLAEADGVDVVGYSMGSMTAAALAAVDRRVKSVVLGGMGGALVGKGGDGSQGASGRATIADALLTDDPDKIESPVGRTFRRFAENTGADRQALAAIQQADRTRRPDVGTIRVPVLVLTGAADTQVGTPQDLADAIPGARVKVVGGTHLSAVNNKDFAPAIVEFLSSV